MRKTKIEMAILIALYVINLIIFISSLVIAITKINVMAIGGYTCAIIWLIDSFCLIRAIRKREERIEILQKLNILAYMEFEKSKEEKDS